MELNKITIGNRIKSLRLELNLKQEELAIKLGLNNKSSISQYEKGDAIPGDDIKLKMCELFNCSLDYLLGKSDVRNIKSIELSDIDIAFASGVKGLNDTNKQIAKQLVEGLLAKQKEEEKNNKTK